MRILTLTHIAAACELGQSELHSALFFECRALADITQQLSTANEPERVSELTQKTAETFEALCTVMGFALICFYGSFSF